MRRLAVLLLVATLAGCGGQRHGTATLWVTRDQGRTVVLTATVPAGETAMQALARKAKIETRYGGRFVQSVNGLSGSASGPRDWFYYVNGIEADRGAAEYRLRPGDVEWWDLRSWDPHHPDVPIVVGAFLEPFLHGYDGKARPTVVRYDDPAYAETARALGRIVRARSVAPSAVPVPKGSNLLHVEGHGRCRTDFCRHFFYASNGGDATGPATFELFPGGAERLVRDPALARFHYGGLR